MKKQITVHRMSLQFDTDGSAKPSEAVSVMVNAINIHLSSMPGNPQLFDTPDEIEIEVGDIPTA